MSKWHRSTVVVVETNNIQTIIGQASKLLNLLPNGFHLYHELMFDSHKSEVRKIQRDNLDELDNDHDLDQVRFEVLFLARTLLLDANSPISVPFFGIKPKHRSTGACPSLEVSKKNETVSLEEIALQFRIVQDITIARNVRS